MADGVTKKTYILCAVCITSLVCLICITFNNDILINTVSSQSYAMDTREKHNRSNMNWAPCTNREHFLREKCLEKGWVNEKQKPLFRNNILVNDKHKVMFCAIPKVGSSSFKALMMKDNTNYTWKELLPKVYQPEFLGAHGVKYLAQYSKEEIQYRIEHYTKFTIVRHPWTRLMSAFKDKIERGSKLMDFFSSVIKRYFDGKLQKNKRGTLKMSFEQFLTLISKEYTGQFLDRHWVSYDDFCDPCYMKYDHVFKMETLESDVDTIFDLYNISSQNYPLRPGTMAEKYQNILEPFRTLDTQVLKRLEDIYARDFELFGYSWNDDVGAECKTVTGNRVCC